MLGILQDALETFATLVFQFAHRSMVPRTAAGVEGQP